MGYLQRLRNLVWRNGYGVRASIVAHGVGLAVLIAGAAMGSMALIAVGTVVVVLA